MKGKETAKLKHTSPLRDEFDIKKMFDIRNGVSKHKPLSFEGFFGRWAGTATARRGRVMVIMIADALPRRRQHLEVTALTL